MKKVSAVEKGLIYRPKELVIVTGLLTWNGGMLAIIYRWQVLVRTEILVVVDVFVPLRQPAPSIV